MKRVMPALVFGAIFITSLVLLPSVLALVLALVGALVFVIAMSFIERK